MNFPAFVFEPQPKCPPIWIGGNGDAGDRTRAGIRRRMASDAARGQTQARGRGAQAKARSERAVREVEIVVRRGFRSRRYRGGARAKVAAERDAGATYFIFDLGRYADEREFTAQAETFMAKVAT